MPKVTEHIARKNYAKDGIEKGQKYFKWTIRTGPASGITYRSLKYPKPWELTGSEFERSRLMIEDQLSTLPDDASVDDVNEILLAIEELRDQQQEKIDNMPEQLTEKMQDRFDLCDEWASILQSFIDELENGDEHVIDDIRECVYPI